MQDPFGLIAFLKATREIVQALNELEPGLGDEIALMWSDALKVNLDTPITISV